VGHLVIGGGVLPTQFDEVDYRQDTCKRG
jgi:hypothetical protein